MDGNGRWARQRGLPRIEGHRRGVETVRKIVEASGKEGVHYLTLFAFSAENWKRPRAEVSALMLLLEQFLRRETAELVRRRIKLHTIGRVDELPAKVQRELARAKDATEGFEDWNLVLALNYGSRTEIADAAAAYAREVVAGRENPDLASWENFSRYLYTDGIPDPDLILRTSGESRISNFLLMQGAYSEIIFSPRLWPDFTPDDFRAALDEYARRERRFGLTGDQVKPPKEVPASST